MTEPDENINISKKWHPYFEIVYLFLYWLLILPGWQLLPNFFAKLQDPNASVIAGKAIMILALTYPLSAIIATIGFFYKNHISRIPAIHLLLIFVSIFLYYYSMRYRHNYAVTDTPIIASERFIVPHDISDLTITPYDDLPAQKDLHVLFIGNHYISYQGQYYDHNLPAVLLKVAKSDSSNPYDIHVDFYAQPNALLSTIWDNPEAQEILKSRSWEYVVLQEHNMTPSNNEWALTRWAVIKWNNAAALSGAKPIILGVWARKAGSHWYSSPQTARALQNFEYYQYRIDLYSNMSAAIIGAPVVPAGDFWAVCSRWNNFPDLYASDASSPNDAGDYLNALLLYRQLTGLAIDNVSYSPPSMSGADVRLIKKCAAL